MNRAAPDLRLALLACALSAPHAQAQQDAWSLPDDRVGVRTAPILLLTRRDVQTELGLSSAQVHSLQRVVVDLHLRAQAVAGKPDPEVIVARREIDEAQLRWLEAQLNDRQRERLLQIDLQWEGPAAVVSRAWVANYLELSAEQRKTLAAQLATHREQAAKAPPRAEDQLVLGRRILAALTKEQTLRWEILIGERFTLQRASTPAEAPNRDETLR